MEGQVEGALDEALASALAAGRDRLQHALSIEDPEARAAEMGAALEDLLDRLRAVDTPVPVLTRDTRPEDVLRELEAVTASTRLLALGLAALIALLRACREPVR